MQLHACLYAVDGQVVCPVSGRRESVERCSVCPALSSHEGQDEAESIVCLPEVDGFAAAMERMIHA